jgi:hypothetical protein
MKAYCFDIKTGINETKQQSTRLEKNNNIHHQSCRARILRLLYQTLVQLQIFVFGLNELLQTRCCNWSLANIAHGLHATQWSFGMQYNIQSVAASCRFANDMSI